VRIAVNTQHLLKDKLEGIGWFAHETLSRITRNHPEHEFLFIFDRPWDKSFIYAENIVPVATKIPSRHPFLWYWHYEKDIPKILDIYKPDVFFSPDGWMSLKTDVPTVDVIHDINFMHRPKDFPWLYLKYYRKYFPLYAQKAKRIVTVSEFSKADIIYTFEVNPGKIDVAYNGCSELFTGVSKEVKATIQSKFAGGMPYFIYVGSLNPRKNIIGILDAFELFKKQTQSGHKLLLVGQHMWSASDIKNKLADMQFRSDVVFTNRLSAEVLQMVMASAEALVMVSFLEGFGIPVIEAMYCDIPVICSNVTSLPEIAGDAALLVNPANQLSIARAFEKIALNTDLRDELIEKGRVQRKKFSWDKTSETVWKAIEKAATE
jgi:glycosyltransferase involved in cell wall biosynthesis